MPTELSFESLKNIILQMIESGSYKQATMQNISSLLGRGSYTIEEFTLPEQKQRLKELLSTLNIVIDQLVNYKRNISGQ